MRFQKYCKSRIFCDVFIFANFANGQKNPQKKKNTCKYIEPSANRVLSN